ncbi:MAG: sigma-70 family RNA polymerase sigma factor [Cyclobacteriaceae bacterium]|nr:sigma-70 family RNA polymerase sigma factor [Cyclobacteriaceae bacterium]
MSFKKEHSSGHNSENYKISRLVGGEAFYEKFQGVSEADIWKHFTEGDEPAFTYIYTKYFDELLNYGIQFTQEISLVEDAIQDMFIDLRRKRKQLKPIKVSLKALLFKSLKNQILMYYRTKSYIREQKFEKDEAAFEIELPFESIWIHQTDEQEERIKLERAIKKLTTRQREVLYYHFYKNLSYIEIQDIMRLENVKSVRNLLYRSLAALKTILFNLPIFYAVVKLG